MATRSPGKDVTGDLTALDYFEVGDNVPDRTMQPGPLGVQKDFTWHQFLDSPVIGVDGKKIKRGQVIKYIANTRGGAHSGYHGVPAKDLEAYHRLDGISQGRVHGRDTVFYALMSIAQDIWRAPDIQRFCTVADELVGQHMPR